MTSFEERKVNMKKEYIKPIISVFELFLEEPIAAGSALISPNYAEDVQTQWETEADDNRSFVWE